MIRKNNLWKVNQSLIFDKTEKKINLWFYTREKERATTAIPDTQGRAVDHRSEAESRLDPKVNEARVGHSSLILRILNRTYLETIRFHRRTFAEIVDLKLKEAGQKDRPKPVLYDPVEEVRTPRIHIAFHLKYHG